MAVGESVNNREVEPPVICEQPRPTAKKTHWKSQSVSEVGSKEGKTEMSSFFQNRELWQRRAASQSALSGPPDQPEKLPPDQPAKLPPDQPAKLPIPVPIPVPKPSPVSVPVPIPIPPPTPTPDLVMDLPTNPEQPTGGLESPDMTTAAERFAKQNQCTLKKNPKPPKPDPSACSPVLLKKNQMKMKPEIMKKPVCLVQSPNVVRKEPKP